MNQMELILFIGIQASGKSTFFQKRYAESHVRINLDMLNTRRKETMLLNCCLEMPQPCVIDNTNPRVLDRKPYIEAAKEKGIAVKGLYFRSSLHECLERNRLREGKARIPDSGIRATQHRLELPDLQEGFDQLAYVSIDAAGEFVVKPWDVML